MLTDITFLPAQKNTDLKKKKKKYRSFIPYELYELEKDAESFSFWFSFWPHSFTICLLSVELV